MFVSGCGLFILLVFVLCAVLSLPVWLLLMVVCCFVLIALWFGIVCFLDLLVCGLILFTCLVTVNVGSLCVIVFCAMRLTFYVALCV